MAPLIDSSRLGRSGVTAKPCLGESVWHLCPGRWTQPSEKRGPLRWRPHVQTSDQAEDTVGIAEPKNLARKLLPSSSALRRLVLPEPDLLPADEIHTRIATYSKLLYLELKES